MKRGLVIGLVLGLSGAAAGVLLVPGGLELAEMKFREIGRASCRERV